MIEMTKKFIFQSIIVWSCMTIYQICNIILNKRYLIGGIALIINIILLADAINSLRMLKKVTIIQLRRK